MAITVPLVESLESLRSAVGSLPSLYVDAGELANAAAGVRIRRAWRVWRPDDARRARTDDMVSDPDWRSDGPERTDVDVLLEPLGVRYWHRRQPFLGARLPLDPLELPPARSSFVANIPAPRIGAMWDARRGEWHYWPALHDAVEALLWADVHADADGLSRPQRDAWRDLRTALTGPALTYWQAYASALSADVERQPAEFGDDDEATNAATGDSIAAGELTSVGGSPAASTQALPTKGRPKWD